MHKQGAVLAMARTLAEGDRVHFGGRGPWRKIRKATVWRTKVLVTVHGNRVHALRPTQFVRVVRS